MSSYDYTNESANGADVDFEIPDAAAPMMTAEEIEKKNSFREVPEGDHILKVISYEAPKPVTVKVKIDGILAVFDSYSVKVQFGFPDDPQCSISDFFTLPPVSAAQVKAYQQGVILNDNNEPTWGGAGREASKFYHFISALGYPYQPGQPLSRESRSLKNWKGRLIGMTVQGGKDHTKNGVTKKRYARVKMFSYRPAVGGNPVQRPASPARPAAPAPAMATAASGVDDI